MTLDLVQVAEQMPALLGRLTHEREQNHVRLQRALDALHHAAADPDTLHTRLQAARTKWPLALPLDEPIDGSFTAPDPPSVYIALATDGSHIDVDRHAPAPCYVLNLGWAAIRYGDGQAAELSAHAELEPRAASLLIHDDEDASNDHTIRGETLSLLRGVRELDRLAELAASEGGAAPLLALLDGNLGLWNVSQAQIPAALRRLLIEGERGLLPALNALKNLTERRPLAFAAYTSRAGTSDVLHALRVAVCPLEYVDCTRCPGLAQPPRPCDEVGLRLDADLFWALLRPGERSAVFRTHSRAFLRAGSEQEHWYEREGHAVAFFYLRLADEVARIELPLWMATPDRLGLLHTLVLDQCLLGPGYPVALQEAHEAAVISTVDRQSFAALLERELALSGVLPGTSAKNMSKRLRGI